MDDARKLLDELLGARIPGTERTVRDTAGEAKRLAGENPIATGALALLLFGTGPGRALAGTALRLGGLAAIGGLAWKAWQNYQRGSPPEGQASVPEIAPPPADSGFDASLAPQGEEAFAETLVRAMIAAAHADGRIDAGELRKIGDRSALSGLADESFLREALEHPASVEDLAAAARTDAQKVELYTAARLAVSGGSSAEREFLARLAERLQLPSALVEHIEATVASVPE